MEFDSLLQIAGPPLLALVGAVLCFLYYIGYFYKVHVTAGPSVISEVEVAYKFHKGNYNDCGPFFEEITKLCPELRGVAVYYDNPDLVDPNACRYMVGAIIAEGLTAKPSIDVVQKLQKNAYKFTKFPKVDFSVKASHPFRINLSAYIAGRKAYVLLINYIKEKGLTAHPFLEIYIDKVLHYMVPLSKHESFYVDELKDMIEGQK